ncbi:MAG TPA: MATE family efflux transporter, partial [Ruminococcaceae bacterium]|nr:MATE family efflux transporter [Oscillospiraceae bacterium]
MSGFQNDLTKGSVTKHLLRFSLPFLASNLLQAFYNMADMLIVGRFDGPVGASAVGTGGTVTILLINMISGLAVGGTVMIAQYIGARKQEEMEKTVGTMFTLYGVAAAVLTVVMLLAGKHILNLLNTPSESFSETLSYLNICMSGTVFVFGYNAVSAVLRGMGDSRHPLIFVLIATITNIVLDLIFVGPLDMGAAGAAWATIIAQALSFILAVIFLRRNNFLFDFHPRSFRIDKKIALQLLKIGLPTSLQGTLVSFSFMWLTRLANDIAGIVGQTSLSVAGKVNSVAILPSIAMQASVSSMAGQNLGAGKPDRARKTMLVAMGLAFSFSSVVFTLVNLFSTQIVTLFIGSGNTNLTPEVV